MNNYCSFSNNHRCLKWVDYQVTRQKLEEADELCHDNWIEIESLQKRVNLLEKLLNENGIPIQELEDDC